MKAALCFSVFLAGEGATRKDFRSSGASTQCARITEPPAVHPLSHHPPDGCSFCVVLERLVSSHLQSNWSYLSCASGFASRCEACFFTFVEGFSFVFVHAVFFFFFGKWAEGVLKRSCLSCILYGTQTSFVSRNIE